MRTVRLRGQLWTEVQNICSHGVSRFERGRAIIEIRRDGHGGFSCQKTPENLDDVCKAARELVGFDCEHRKNTGYISVSSRLINKFERGFRST